MHESELGPFTTRYAAHGMVCSADHTATSVGVAVLRAGGSAVDAAIATNAVLAVTSPHLCGMGGDLLALVHEPGRPPAALLASGRAGSGADAERLRAEGRVRMPFRGDIRSVPMPGCVDGWVALHQRYGRLPLTEVLEPAARAARDGFAASTLLSLAAGLLAGVPAAEEITVARGAPGHLVRRTGTAGALEAVAARGRDGFYLGPFGEGFVALSQGEHVEADLATSSAIWLDPLVTRVWDHDVWTVPPPSQGYLVLAAAALAERWQLGDDPLDPAWPHTLIEAARVASFDRPDVLHERADGAALLASATSTSRAAAFTPERSTALPVPTATGDTTYVCATDASGTAISLIQSNAADFGAHLVEPATGTFLHNRGIGFSLRRDHPAEYGPGRRPPTTLAPCLVTRPSGELRAVLGTMSGDSQPQVVLQLLARLLRVGERPGTAVAAPRWVLARRSKHVGFDLWDDLPAVGVDVEARAPEGWVAELGRRGHDVRVGGAWQITAGHAHIIEATQHGWAGAADPRAGSGGASGW